MLKNAFNVQSPVFRPLWLRILLVACIAGWTLLELSNANYVWAAIFAIASAYLAYEFFVVFDPDSDSDKEDDI